MTGAAVYKRKDCKEESVFMQNITGMIGRYLSGVSLPSMNIIDIIEIILIAFFVYQFMVWIKFTRAYTLLKGLLVIGCFSCTCIYF